MSGGIEPSGFDAKVQPAVTAGAYSAGEVVGGLLTFAVSDGAPSVVMVTGVTVALKAAVTSTLTLHLFDAAPATIADNAAYALGTVADVFKHVASLTGFTLVDHGTPNTYQLSALSLVVRPADGANLYGYLMDGTGFTLTSVSDVQVRLAGHIL